MPVRWAGSSSRPDGACRYSISACISTCAMPRTGAVRSI
jgi:hypothetical protein